MMRETTERVREMQPLTYLATRDELTGHLNRNALRAELAQAIERAKDEAATAPSSWPRSTVSP